MSSKKRLEGLDSRNKIIATATELMGEKGVVKVTLSEIATRAGISKGTLYYYYATKNDLVFDITLVHMERLTSEIFDRIDMDGAKLSWEDLLKHILTLILESETRGRLHLYLVSEAIAGNEPLRKRFHETYHRWFSMVQDGHERLTGQKQDFSAESMLFVAALDGFIIQKLMGVDLVVDDISTPLMGLV